MFRMTTDQNETKMSCWLTLNWPDSLRRCPRTAGPAPGRRWSCARGCRGTSPPPCSSSSSGRCPRPPRTPGTRAWRRWCRTSGSDPRHSRTFSALWCSSDKRSLTCPSPGTRSCPARWSSTPAAGAASGPAAAACTRCSGRPPARVRRPRGSPRSCPGPSCSPRRSGSLSRGEAGGTSSGGGYPATPTTSAARSSAAARPGAWNIIKKTLKRF